MKNENDIDIEELKKYLQQDIEDIVSHNLQKKIDINTDLFSYGIDSIKQMEIAGEVNKKFNIEINPVVFVKYDTIKSFCEYMLGDYKDELNSHYHKIQSEIQTHEK